MQLIFGNQNLMEMLLENAYALMDIMMMDKIIYANHVIISGKQIKL